MTIEEQTQRQKKQSWADRLQAVEVEAYGLDKIDVRLFDYVKNVQQNPDMHNLREIQAVVRFLSFMNRYYFWTEKVTQFTQMYESLKFSGLEGRQSYKLTPIQYFLFASMKGFYKWEYTGETEGEDRQIDARHKVEGGKKYELVRLVNKAIWQVPRKFSKTTSVASLAVDELLFGEANAEAYCAANSYTQAKICYKEIKGIITQLDPQHALFKTNRESITWKKNSLAAEGRPMESKVECLSGGGGNKDGLNASLVIYDEYAQARYVKDHSDGAELLQVLQSSMGVRREPLTIIITTASRIPNGPYSLELENALNVLDEKYEMDSLFALIMQPDEWEVGDQYYGDEKLWRKVNPHIGITVRESFYAKQWADAQHNAEAMLEFKTKLLNVFTANSTQSWMPASTIRQMQRDYRKEENVGRPDTMLAFDLSISDDFSVAVYNTYDQKRRIFYLDLDCYVPEYLLENHANGELYKVWVKEGWMNTCKGKIIDNMQLVSDMLRNNGRMCILKIGYDPYKAQETINALAAAVQARGGRPDDILKPVSQTYGSFTNAVDYFEATAKSDPPKVVFSNSPLWPFCFGNAYLDVDAMGNKKPLKRQPNQKIDAVIGCLMTFKMYMEYYQS